VEEVRLSGKKAEAAKIDATLSDLLEWGSPVLVTMKKAEKMNDVWQLRSGKHRVFYFWDAHSETYVILHGFRKTTRKTPPHQLARAESLVDTYLMKKES